MHIPLHALRPASHPNPLTPGATERGNPTSRRTFMDTVATIAIVSETSILRQDDVASQLFTYLLTLLVIEASPSTYLSIHLPPSLSLSPSLYICIYMYTHTYSYTEGILPAPRLPARLPGLRLGSLGPCAGSAELRVKGL